jgi:protein phosphatase
MRLVSWSKTDTGKKRDHNEDSFLADDGLRLYAVADGMGGHQGGGHASKLALEVLRREVEVTGGDFAAAAAALVGSAPRVGRNTDQLPAIDDADTVQEQIGDDDTLDGSEIETPSTPRAGAGPGTQRVGEEETQPSPVTLSPAEIVMARAAKRAGEEIYDTAQTQPELQGMGTTLSALVYDRGHMHYAHAGDSRAYLFRDGKLRQLTEDHSWIWEQIKSGAMTEAEARTSKFRHIITRSVGFERELEVDTGGIAVQAGDCFLLCSDGMSNYIENEELERILDTTWFRRTPQFLIDIANDRGGDDNITVVIVFVANDIDER